MARRAGPGAEPATARRPAGTALITAALAFLGAAAVAWQLTRPGLLFGVTPDVSVYVGGAVRLVHGAVPYRDFVFVQPPGFVLLATPIAWLSNAIGTRDALAVLRLSTPLLAAADVALLGALLRHRGRAAVVVGCSVMALHPAEMYAIRGPQLEPVIVVLCLVGARMAFNGDALAGRRRLLVAGALMGFAVAVKQPAVLPVLVLGALCVAAGPRRRLLPFLGGAAAGFAAPVLPFFAMAPSAFIRDTVTTQLGRIPVSGRIPWTARIADLTGVSTVDATAAAAIAVAAVLVAIVVAAHVLDRSRPRALEWFALATAIAVAAVQLAPARYYVQYAAFIAPFLALVLGTSASRLASAWRHRPALAMALALAPLLALLVVMVPYVARESVADVATEVDAVVPSGGCALSDSPVYLFTSDRFQASERGCTLMADPAGTILALGDRSSVAVAVWRDAFVHIDYVVTATPVDAWDLPRDAGIPAYVAANFSLVRSQGLLIYVRRHLPANGATQGS